VKRLPSSAISAVLLAAVCTVEAGDPPASQRSVKIENVPHVRQKEDFCGEACAEMYLSKLKHNITQDDVFNVSGVEPGKGRGCFTKDMHRALLALGFKPGKAWFKVDAGSDKHMRQQWNAIHADLLKGIPTIVCMRTGNHSSATEHMRLILGYDQKENEVIYHEPAEDEGAYQRMKLDHFLDCWPLKYKTDKWTVIRLRLDVDKIKQPPKSDGFTNADFAQHMMTLKHKIPGNGFTVVIQRPFVVIGDESPLTVNSRADNTVRSATKRLKSLYFKKDPSHIIDIWLFKNKASYRRYTREIFGDDPDTPYGYSSTAHKALIMNIGTGGGTLVHEIVHPFIDSNFPECPAWLNEGLGSLYEQSKYKRDTILGMTNWRLPGLQEAIKEHGVPSFKALTSTTTYEFYQLDSGTNYAQARYLCYYLQEKGLLTKFYHAFQANCKDDPTGYKTLKKTLKEKDMDAFKKRWEKYILSLRFPA
jgi:hypothetical protein